MQHGTFRGRDDDTFAVGYTYGNVNPNLHAYEDSLNAQGYAVPVNGRGANYGVQIAPLLSLCPGLQYGQLCFFLVVGTRSHAACPITSGLTATRMDSRRRMRKSINTDGSAG